MKNSELAGVLIKFEERVKQRDKRLEEAIACEHSLKRDVEHKDAVSPIAHLHFCSYIIFVISSLKLILIIK